jgi:hypothetical protein
MANKKNNRGSDNPYLGLEEEFGIPTGSTVEALFEGLDEVDKKVAVVKENMSVALTSKDFKLRNQEYIEFELMELISSAKGIRDKLEQEVKIGADNRTYEVYATLINAIGQQIEAMMRMSMAYEKAKIDRAKVRMAKEKIKKLEDYTKMGSKEAIPMTSSQLLDIIQKASEQSQLRTISTEFEVVEEYKEDNS